MKNAAWRSAPDGKKKPGRERPGDKKYYLGQWLRSMRGRSRATPPPPHQADRQGKKGPATAAGLACLRCRRAACAALDPELVAVARRPGRPARSRVAAASADSTPESARAP